MTHAPARRSPTIGVIDSGVGGLSVLAAVRERLPSCRFRYVADNLHYPYGLRAEDDVVRCVVLSVDRVLAREPLDLLIVACNTASTVVLPALRQRHAFPIVGVVPAVKPAAQRTRTGTIGLLATPLTVNVRYMDELIAEHAPGKTVVRVGSNILVGAAEAKLRGEPVDLRAIAAEIAPFFSAVPGRAPVDVCVLGCTHFPLLREELAKAAPHRVLWLDSAEAIAARVASLLGTLDVSGAALPPLAYFTREGPDVEALRPTLERLGFGAIHVLEEIFP